MTATADLVIENGTIVTEDLTFAASLAIRDGRITAIGAADDMPAAAATMAKMRPVMLTNLTLGLIVTAIGIAGPAMFPG